MDPQRRPVWSPIFNSECAVAAHSRSTLYGMTIPLGIDGCVVNSTHASHFVRVEDDRANTGGFLVYEWWNGADGPNEKGAFDAWVENENALESFFEESKWSVKWATQ